MNSSLSWKQRFLHEMRVYVFLTLFLTLFLCSLSSYRRLILGESAIDFVRYGYNFVEAMILAKIILLGRFFKLGERYLDKSLIFPTIYGAVIMTCFVVVFAAAEKFVTGFFEGKMMADVYHHLLTHGFREVVGVGPVFFFFFIVFFAFIQLERVIGEDKLFNLFFNRKNTGEL